MTRRQAVAPPPPFLPAPYELADLSAVQAVARGEADGQQQKRALKWIIEQACDTYGLGWHPDGPHAASFVAGRRFSGMQVVKAVNVNISLLRKTSDA